MSDSHVGRPRQKSNGNRPKYSYFTMISMAIEHQEDQKATIKTFTSSSGTLSHIIGISLTVSGIMQ